MEINTLIIYIMVVFMIIGAVDRMLGNRFGYGKKFEEGIMAMGPLALSMIGIISLSPVIAKGLKPIITPFYEMIGADPALFAGTILANDMGGWSLGSEIAKSHEGAVLGGLILSATLGATLSFSIPVAMGMVKKSDEKYLSKGILAGILTIPLGCFIGGIVAGFGVKFLIINLIPTFIITVLLGILLFKYPKKVAKSFSLFGKFMTILITIGLLLESVRILTGVTLVPNLFSALEASETVCKIGMVLSGAFPLTHFITKVFAKPLQKVGTLIGVNETSVVGFIACLAHNIPMLSIVDKMDAKGKIMNIAFSVSGAFVFGSHLGFTAGIDKSMVFPVIIAKLSGGITAMIVGSLLYKLDKEGAFVFGSHLGFTAGIDKSMVFPVIIAKLSGGITAMIVGSLLYKLDKE